MGENRVTILFAFALLYAYHHPVRVRLNMVGFKAHQFADPQPCAINGLQQQPVFKVVRCSKQAFYFLLAKGNRQLFNTGSGRDMQPGVVPFANMAVKADNA